jgi:uncharacterized protein (DUF427 family)
LVAALQDADAHRRAGAALALAQMEPPFHEGAKEVEQAAVKESDPMVRAAPFYEEDERIVGHAADFYHRIDIRQTSRHLVVREGGRSVADTSRPLALYESGFAPRWYVPRDDVDLTALTPIGLQTFCPYKGVCSYFDIGRAQRAGWSYEDSWAEVRRISGLVSFEPDRVEVYLDGVRLRLDPGQTVIPHGVDRDLTLDQAPAGGPP